MFPVDEEDEVPKLVGGREPLVPSLEDFSTSMVVVGGKGQVVVVVGMDEMKEAWYSTLETTRIEYRYDILLFG